MGGNGSFVRKDVDNGIIKYDTIGTIGDYQIVEYKNKKQAKMPEESHTPNQVYVTFKKDGTDVKAIAKYGGDGKKLYEIHTDDHKGIKPHFHPWKDGKPTTDAFALTDDMKKLLNNIRNFKS